MNPLKEKILALIRSSGPIGIAHYMHIALCDPEHGYYNTRDPLGRDFITAPEISQIFGELIGLFFVQAWEDRGAPKKFHLVELGPGRGTLMADMLRAARIRPAFLDAAHIALIETSPVLRAMQKRNLKDTPVTWLESLNGLDGAPIFAIANEFLDALPAHQYVKSGGIWRMRTVTADEDNLSFGLASAETESIPAAFHDAPDGSVFENGIEAKAAIRHLSGHSVSSHGVALIIDYGHMRTSLGDTFQAVKAHGYADPLAEPGEADLTFHADFAALSETAREAGARVSGPITQGDFLQSLGIGIRAERLKHTAPEHAPDIDAAIQRLAGADHMGTLFKVMAIAPPGSPHPPGFPC